MHVFTYGSLMFPQVWSRVVRGTYRHEPAMLEGYARCAILGETYPAIVAEASARVEGMLYFDVTPEDVAALDVFEGEEYRRENMHVKLPSGEEVEAGTYLYLLPQRLARAP